MKSLVSVEIKYFSACFNYTDLHWNTGCASLTLSDHQKIKIRLTAVRKGSSTVCFNEQLFHQWYALQGDTSMYSQSSESGFFLSKLLVKCSSIFFICKQCPTVSLCFQFAVCMPVFNALGRETSQLFQHFHCFE